jgi:choline dehydrogenase-like flavoprotein
MILTLDDLAGDADYDICIIGSGPAGGTVANELADSGYSVCVLESGKWAKSSFANQLKDVDASNLKIKAYSRERMVGGTSNTWAGLSAPLDPIDFQPRSWAQVEGWPIEYEDLAPYYSRASSKYLFPDLLRFDKKQWSRRLEQGTLNPNWKTLVTKSFLARVEPQNFRQQFQDVYHTSSTDLITDATVVGLIASRGKDSARGVVAQNRNVKKVINAKCFVLAANGIENARLLLLSNTFGPDGLGNDRDVVGRYFMNHPKNYFGTVKLSKELESLPAYFGFLENGFAGYLGLKAPDSLQISESILNSYVRFEPIFDWSESPGVESLLSLVKQVKFVQKGFRQANKKKMVELRHYAETGDDSDLQNSEKSAGDYGRIAFDLARYAPDVIQYLFRRLTNQTARAKRIRIRNFMEMEPCSQNRVALSDRTDYFGNSLPLVEAETSRRDKATMERLHQLLGDEISQQELGVLEQPLSAGVTPWPIDADASHHLGTTRMGKDPKYSVVNADCRVHDCENVYVAGGSVFSTSGNANPTYTVVALSIRLADHLQATLRRQAVEDNDRQASIQ